MLLVLVEVERMFDLVTKTVTFRRLRVPSVLLLVDVASTTTLCCCKCQSIYKAGFTTYACVELILRFACRQLRDNIGRTTRLNSLWCKTRRFAHVASTSTTGGEFTGCRFALGTFACDSSVRVNGIITTDVAGAYDGSVAVLKVGFEFVLAVPPRPVEWIGVVDILIC
jgi:hypothetical protein